MESVLIYSDLIEASLQIKSVLNCRIRHKKSFSHFQTKAFFVFYTPTAIEILPSRYSFPMSLLSNNITLRVNYLC